jgi:phosphoglycolate phosphatase-like HAD superfamily hydrolase
LKKLALFDIDGTLTDTNRIDGECFVAAWREQFAGASIDDDWSQYPHTTDRGILRELFRRSLSREATEADLEAHRVRFIEHLRERMQSGLALPGAIEFLAILPGEGWTVVLCTGAWGESARLKLDRAGFPFGLRVASCDQFESREDIVRHGIALAGGLGDTNVIFGDATWDVHAARNLALPFIGVGGVRRAERLRAAGAEHVIADYSDATEVLRLMGAARPPR